MLKRVMAFASVLAIAGLVLAGCGQKQQASQDKAADKGQAGGSVIELKFHHHDPPTSDFARNGVEQWAKMIEERTNGKVKITIYPAETLGKAKDAYEMVTNGIADIAWGFVGFFPGRFPMTEVIDLPMLGIPSAEVGSKVLWDLYANTPYLKGEFPGVKVLALHCNAVNPIGTSKKAVRTLEDLKGLKVRTPAGPPTEFMKQAGALPVLIPAPDIFENMQKGTIDGYSIDWQGIKGFRLPEVSNYITDVNLFIAPFWIIMNEQKWNSLPADVQKAIEEVSGQFAAQHFGKVFDESEKQARARVKELNKEIIPLTPEEQQRWVSVAQKVWDKWVNDMEASKKPAKTVLEETQKLIKKYTGQ